MGKFAGFHFLFQDEIQTVWGSWNDFCTGMVSVSRIHPHDKVFIAHFHQNMDPFFTFMSQTSLDQSYSYF